ncbi:DUF3443 domain-containing protein [Duganella sp. BJB488]|uniref:DUF3443 domain-containing protein n=1 Tax=unclassified Duganella TaxID=2636909 RepID=UPI000E351FCF|nr:MULTISPECIES: DUF3443 domain-containing protein [unclassified Duganella]RFP25804.1 DUF3443 domain-containing protein [Duganella sp. BJB489]RFP28455.1 DUF3443 domain-containing protein [Duganella sp. BJB488]RFP36735.1 DUF3443 domain-containing protein [Duganella sp. BJB480]
MHRSLIIGRLRQRAGAALLAASGSTWFIFLASFMLALMLSACGGGGSGAATSAAQTTQSTSQAGTGTPVVSISATPTATTVGQVVTLSWSVSNPGTTGCTASGAWSGALDNSGSRTVTAGAAGTAYYTVTCGGVSKTTSVVVSSPPPSPTVNLTLAPASITTAQTSVLSWSSANASACTASGAWSGAKASSGSVSIASSVAGNYVYTLSCAGDGGTVNASAALSVTAPLSNSTAIVVDSGPTGVNGTINIPYVSVTVCRPGTTTCQTIDHVLLDTGSYGLRLLAPLDAALNLPAVQTPSGADAGTCGKFISGYTWGAVRQADVKMADETAAGISIQVIGDSGANYAATPSSCSSAGNNLGTLAALGAKGVLGVGLFKQDCGDSCARSAVGGAYYACTGNGCTASSMALASQVGNPVASFAVNNNGVLLVLPGVGASGLTSVSGTLIFGVNTQANNTIAGETLFTTNSGGDFSTTYKGKTYGASFIDSGSNGYFFNDSTLRTCSGGDFYCPASTLSLSATNAAADGSASGVVNFNVANLVQLASTISAAQVGGTAGTGNYFDWGLPFFYGRRVFVVMEGASVNGKTGPLWAY